MSQSQLPKAVPKLIPKLIPKVRFNLNNRRNLKNPQGPPGRHEKIRKVVTALIKHERIEVNYNRGDESRGYAERLISDAIRYGDCHKPTMEMASYWILEKQLIHKLFKVLAPRYRNSTLSYTKMWRAPSQYPLRNPAKCVLELRNNVYPALGPDTTHNKNLIHNVLLKAAKEAHLKENSQALQSAVDADQMTAQASKEMLSDVNDESGTDSTLESTATVNEIKMDSAKDELMSNEIEAAKLQSNASFDKMSVTDNENEKNIDSEAQVEKDLNINEMKITDSEVEDGTNKEKVK